MFSPVFKTFLFLGFLSALLVVIGYAIGGTGQAIFFFFISLIINFGAYWFSERIALKMSGAIPLPREKAPQLYLDVEDLCRAMNIPVPKIYYSYHSQANAFATGRNPKHSSICFTQGIFQLLNKHELHAVIAHELSHIKNRDVLIVTIAAVLSSTISGLSRLTFWFGNSKDNNGEGSFKNIFMLLLAPLAALILQMALSRQREFAADEGSAKFTHQPENLAHALRKIEASVSSSPMHINPALSSLYIENPLSVAGVMELFSTHPPTQQRIQRLLHVRV